jgi:hypothetical protein
MSSFLQERFPPYSLQLLSDIKQLNVTFTLFASNKTNPTSISMKNIAMLILLLAALAPLHSFGQKEQTKTFKGIKSVKMSNSSGNCRIVKSTDGTVTVKLRYTYDDRDVENTMEQEGDRLVIRETFHANNVHGSSEWTISVPDGISVRYSTGSGSIRAEDLKADLNITTGSGDLVFTKVSGTIGGTTGSGDLELDGFKGELNINIGSGSAMIDNSEGDLDLNCGSGNIRVNQSKAAFKLNTGSGNIAGKSVSLSGASNFNSGSGDASVVLASSPQYDIFVNSGSGDAELNFNGNAIAGEVIMEASKEHGKIVAPFEFDKTEEIGRGNKDDLTVRKTAIKGKGTNKIKVGTGSGDAVLKQ